ncbi:MAG: hypothetical protein IPN80_06580 [Flavobacterium sp.]|nr:hypothetical protein [Flavobacterium sp.]
MGLNKLEKEFKRQLDQREIKPSPAAWDRLDAMLTITEEKNRKSSCTAKEEYFNFAFSQNQ